MAEQQRPTGTIAFLFTDIESSTELWQQYRDLMTRAVLSLDELVENLASGLSGVMVHERGEGDSHFVVFDHASRAVVAAADLMAATASEPWPENLTLKMRAGVHIGEIDDGFYYGASVNQAARLRSLAYGGQAVTSRTVADVVTGRLPSGLWLESLGQHRIRNWPSPSEVFQIRRADLQHDFPPLRSEDQILPAMVAVVVVDIADSTGFARRADHDQLVDRHRKTSQRLREIFDGLDGRAYRAIGDGCIAGFDTPADAINFARIASADLAADGKLAKVGIDFGPVELVEGELSGHATYVASELERRAEPGTIVVSSIVSELVGRLNYKFTALGPATLRSAATPIETFLLYGMDPS